MTIRQKILIVDDDPLIRKFIRANLEARNYEVSLAENGIAALEIFQKEKIDLVLLDIDREWTVEVQNFLSKGRNTPFAGCRLKGMVVATVGNGQLSWRDKSLRIS